MIQLTLFADPPREPQVWLVEFRHDYFGWLDLDHRFPSREEAAGYLRANPSPYRQRMRRIS